MGKCKYCGKSAGILNSYHEECKTQHDEYKAQYDERQNQINIGRDKIVTAVEDVLRSTDNFNNLQKMISDTEKDYSVPLSERDNLLVSGWENAVEHFLEDGIIDAAEEKRLVEFKEHFALSQNDLDKNGAYTNTLKAAVLRDIFNGIMPQRISVDVSFPINFQKGEQMVWAFSGSEYLEDKTSREYVGRSQGVSVRIMQGLYYRTGGFKGHAVERTERVYVDIGWVAITDKNIYFAGSKKSVRIPYTKIVSFEQFSDGIGIIRDANNAKPQIFVTGDGWFTYNLVANLSRSSFRYRINPSVTKKFNPLKSF